MSVRRNGLWVLFAIFFFVAIYFHEGESLFISQGKYPAGKLLVWLVFISFLAYSVYCSTKENIFRTIRAIYPLHWARQIGIDLYLGLGVAMFIIYLNEGSILVLVFWLVPIILFANLAVLLYLAMNYDSIVSHFL
ncbi:hypothetical protein [Microbulbifer epialgicus]|uniref:Tripartite ATP-independent transporter, DctQ component n=1 Tax=Microbulbifer epialgicus TaxID=393907 RepID=A0ABV4P540_9GAMM